MIPLDRWSGRRRPASLALLLAGCAALGVAWPLAAQPSIGDWSAPTWPIAGPWLSEATIVTDASGTVHVAWTEAGDAAGASPTHIGLSTLAPSGWTGRERVPCAWPAVSCSDPSLAVDAFGIIHLVYVAMSGDGAAIEHRARSPGATRWSLPETVSTGRADVRRLDPVVLADRIGHVHVTWSDGSGGGDVLYRQRLPDGQWRDVTHIHDPADGAQTSPALALADNGTVHAVWRDDRDGTLAVWTSQLPERSFIWWPDAPLSRPEDGTAGAPAIAATANGVVSTAWTAVDDVGAVRIHAARLTPAGPYWEPARRVHEGEFGDVLDVALAAGPTDDVVIVWTEARGGGRSRLYAARLAPSGALVDRRRVDGTVRLPGARTPVVASDGLGQAIVAWDQRTVDGSPSFALSFGRLPEPERPWSAFEGYLEPEATVFGCQRDGYRLVGCDGETTILVLSDAPALARLAGAYVAVQGWVIGAPGCRRVTAVAFGLHAAPCDRSSATAYGSVWQDGRPQAGARITVGERSVLSGSSGRFALTGVRPGTAAVTATAPCALSLSAGSVTLQPRQRLDLGPAAFIAGDVVADCIIDVRDLARAAWDARQPPDATHACSDVNRDGAVDIGDLDLIRMRMGLRCPQPWSPTPMPPPARASIRDDVELADGF